MMDRRRRFLLGDVVLKIGIEEVEQVVYSKWALLL